MVARDEGCADGGGERAVADGVRYRNPWSVQVSAFAAVGLGTTAFTVALMPYSPRQTGPLAREVPLWFVVSVGVVLAGFNGGVLLSASRCRPMLSSSLVCWGCGFLGLLIGAGMASRAEILMAAEMGWIAGCCLVAWFLPAGPRLGARCCECGYDAVGLAVCPECGMGAEVGSGRESALTTEQRRRVLWLLWVVPGLLAALAVLGLL